MGKTACCDDGKWAGFPEVRRQTPALRQVRCGPAACRPQSEAYLTRPRG